VTVLLRAMGYVEDEQILEMFDNSLYIRNTIEADTEVTKTEEGALIELFKKQRPGEPPSIDNARNLLNSLFFDPKRYDPTRVGRYKLTSRLPLDEDPDTRVLTHRDIIELIKELVSLPRELGVPESGEYDNGEPIKDFALEAIMLPREPIAERLDEYEHFGNRRLRTVGELIQEAFRIGLYRMERVVRERLTTEDADTITPQTIINIRPVVAAQKEFFGSSQLSQFMDQTNSLSGLTHRRRLSALGAGGLTRERAPIEVRDVHPTHYGRMCPIETPEGPNIGLMGSLGSYAKVSEHGFVQTPYRKIEYVDADRIVVATKDGNDSYDLVKYRRSNQGTIIHQKPIVYEGQRVSAGEVMADGSSTDMGELALGKNLLVAFMSWEGYNFEDAIILSERIVKDDVLTSIHIHEYEVDARSTKLGDEEITRDIPNRSEESLRD